MIDDRTATSNLPLPHIDNTLDVDVGRLRDALTGIDAGLAGKAPTSHSHSIAAITSLQTALNGKQAALGFTPISTSAIGAPNGVAGLDASGKVNPSLFPAFVDAVVSVANAAARPAVGATGKLYITTDNNKSFRWSGSAYVEVSAAPASTTSVPEGTGLYFTTARVLATVLAGLSTATNAAVSASDTVLVAFGKLQKQITDLISTLAAKQDLLSSGVNIKTVGGASLLGTGDVSPVVSVSATTASAVAGGHYVLTNVAASTVTLPASPASGATVAVTVANGLVTNVIARNGQTIMGLAENLTIDSVTTVTLRFLNSSWRIV